MSNFQRAVAHVEETLLQEGPVTPMIMGYTADAVITIPLAKVVGEDGSVAIADMISLYFLANSVTSYLLIAPVRDVVVVAEIHREARTVRALAVKRNGGVSVEPVAVPPEVLAGRLFSLLPTDDLALEDDEAEVAEWMIKSLGMRRLPIA